MTEICGAIADTGTIPWNGYTFVATCELPVGARVTRVEAFIGVPQPEARPKIVKWVSGNTWRTVVEGAIGHGGGGWSGADFDFTVPGPGYRPAWYVKGTTDRSVAAPRLSMPGNVTAQATYNADTAPQPVMRAIVGAIAEPDPEPGEDPPADPADPPVATTRHVILRTGQSNCVNAGTAVMKAAYQEAFSGIEAVVLNTAVNASTIGEWQPGSAFLEAAIAAVMTELEVPGTVFAWHALQRGEAEGRNSRVLLTAAWDELAGNIIREVRVRTGVAVPTLVVGLFKQPPPDAADYDQWLHVQQMQRDCADPTRPHYQGLVWHSENSDVGGYDLHISAADLAEIDRRSVRVMAGATLQGERDHAFDRIAALVRDHETKFPVSV